MAEDGTPADAGAAPAGGMGRRGARIAPPMRAILGVPALVAALVMLAGCAARAASTAGTGTADSSPTGPHLFSCVAGAAADPAGTCARMVADFRRRAPLPPADRDAAQAAIGPVNAALVRHTHADCASPAAPCRLVVDPADPAEVRRQLAAAGHPDARVRLALADDPAPVGSVVYAIPIGHGCLIGYLASGDTSPNSRPAGPLLSGGCLSG